MKVGWISSAIINIGMTCLIVSFGVLFLLGLGVIVLSILGALFLMGTGIIIEQAFEKKDVNEGVGEK